MNQENQKRTSFIFGVSVLLVVILALLVACSLPPPPVNSISGHVYESGGKTPIAKVTIEALAGKPLNVKGTAITDSDGWYMVTGLAAGEYTVVARATGYRTESYGDTSFIETRPEERLRVTVRDDMATTGIDFRLKALASISGRVYRTDNGKPIAGVTLFVYGPHWCTGPINATTDANGRYVVTGLNAGESTVAAEAEGYVIRFYDGVYSSEEVTKVVTTYGRDTSNIDFALEWGGSVSGHVYQTDGVTPVVEARVWFEQTAGVPTPRLGGCVPLPRGQYVTTATDGSYNITGLNSGDYYLSVSAKNIFSSGTRLVSVIVGKETPSIDFTLIAGGSLSGHVYESDGRTPIPRAGVGVMLQEEHYMGGYWQWNTNAGSDGGYTFPGVPPGEYLVHAMAEHHKGISYNSAGSLKGPPTKVIVLSGEETTGIDFALPR